MKGYEYDEDLDILYVNNNPEKEKSAGTIVFGNIVIDVGEHGKVLGVEADCASKIFNFPAEKFNELLSAKVHIGKMDNVLMLGIALVTPVREHTFQFAIQESENQIPVNY